MGTRRTKGHFCTGVHASISDLGFLVLARLCDLKMAFRFILKTGRAQGDSEQDYPMYLY